MTKIKYFLFIFMLFIFDITPINAQQKGAFSIKTVVIDPGHGGRDPGAVYGKYKEKDIVLDVGLKLGKMIKRNYPSVNIVYTRSKDVFVPLDNRSKIANDAKGDLFISIHVNSVSNASSARGVETFTIGMHKNAANLAVAQKENSVIALENGYEKTYEGFDPNDEESYIMFGLGQHAYQRKSLSLSFEVQNMFGKYLPTSDRGMKQAGFLVLWRTSMPSILTEIGFISNSKDRQYLCNDSGRDKIVKSLFEAFVKYKSDVEVVSHYDIKQDGQTLTSNRKGENYPNKKSSNPEVYYSVQILVSKVQQSLNHQKFDAVGGKIKVNKYGRLYKYFAGMSVSYEEMLSLQNVLRKNGFKDAFIVAFDGDKLISISKAMKIL